MEPTIYTQPCGCEGRYQPEWNEKGTIVNFRFLEWLYRCGRHA